LGRSFKKKEVTGGGGNYSGKLHHLNCSPYFTGVIKSRRMRWMKQVVCIGEMSCAYILIGKSKGKIPPLGRPRLM
jgi:hypothetical protein